MIRDKASYKISTQYLKTLECYPTLKMNGITTSDITGTQSFMLRLTTQQEGVSVHGSVRCLAKKKGQK